MRPPTAPLPTITAADQKGESDLLQPPGHHRGLGRRPAKSGASWTATPTLIHYADCLNQAGLDVFEEGYLSEDLAVLCDPAELKEMPENAKLMKLIRARLETLLAA